MRQRDALKLRRDDKVDVRLYKDYKNVWKQGFVLSVRKFRGKVQVVVKTPFGDATVSHLDVRPTSDEYHNNLTTLVRILHQETHDVMVKAMERIKKRVAKECPNTKFKAYAPNAQMKDMDRISQEIMSGTMYLLLGDFQCSTQDLVRS